MSGRWHDLGPGGEATAEAAFVALQTAAALAPAGPDPKHPAAAPSPSALWAHVTGARPMARAELAAALLAAPSLRATLAGMMERTAHAVGPRVAAAASGERVAERGGPGFRLRLLPARGAAGQTWIRIELDRPEPAPATLTVLPAAGGPPLSVALDEPQDGVVQLLAETASELVGALGDPGATLYLH